MTISRPQEGEYPPIFARYLAHTGAIADPLTELSAQRDRFLSRLSPLTDERARFRYAPDKWSVKEMIGHLSDVERVFAYRMLRIGRGDQTPLPGFEENDYARAAQSDRRPLADLLAEWSAVRDATSALAVGLPEPGWAIKGTANNAPMTPRALLYMILGHTEHHLGVLADRYGVR